MMKVMMLLNQLPIHGVMHVLYLDTAESDPPNLAIIRIPKNVKRDPWVTVMVIKTYLTPKRNAKMHAFKMPNRYIELFELKKI